MDAGIPATLAELHARGWAGPPAMAADEVLNVPPNGSCVFHCVVCCRDVQRLRDTPRMSCGFVVNSREEAELAEASRRLRLLISERALDDDRYDVFELLASSAYPEGAVLTYLAQWLGGTLHVVVDGLESDYDLLFGQGPIQAQLLLTYITGPDGTRAPHYMLSGSWVPQVATRQRRARKRSHESSSSSASSTASM